MIKSLGRVGVLSASEHWVVVWHGKRTTGLGAHCRPPLRDFLCRLSASGLGLYLWLTLPGFSPKRKVGPSRSCHLNAAAGFRNPVELEEDSVC